MPHDSFATSADLISWLQGAGALDDDMSVQQRAIDYDQAMQSAIDRWEGDTQISPWIATQQTLRFDAPRYQGGPRCGDTIYLMTGLLSVTTLRVQVTALSSGIVLVEGTDFWLGPTENPRLKKPYTRIQFRYPHIAFAPLGFWQPQTIEIDGLFGFAETVADDVWNAVRDAGAIEVLPSLAKLRTGDAVSEEKGDVKTVYITTAAKGPFSMMIDACEDRYQKTLARKPYQMQVAR